MTIASLPSLVEALRACRILTAAQMEEVAGDLQARFPDVRALARELVLRGWVTPFQMNQLFQARGQELTLWPYVLLERLGEGGMGQVFKARHQLMNRLVALKLIRKERLSSPDAVRRFYREIQVVSQLSHPNIVMAHDAAQVGETHFLVMEYVEGVDLAKVVKQREALPVGEACEYIRQTALGLQHAHECGLVHRDIKPANLLVTARGGVVKLLDMGLARLQTADGDDSASMLTQEGSVMGTADYIAPEQALDSHQVDIRSDIYSLGCSLYFVLTRQPPFPGGTLGEKLVKHQLKEPIPVEKIRADVPLEVAEIVRKMMAKRPDDRYQSPLEVVQALQPYSRPAPSPGIGWPQRAHGEAAPSMIPVATLMTGLPGGPGGGTLTAPMALFMGTGRAVPRIMEHTIDPTAPAALPLSGSLPKQSSWGRVRAAARRSPGLAVATGTVLLGLVVGLLLVMVGVFWKSETPPSDGKIEPAFVLGGERGRHWGAARCVAYSFDGRLAASAGDDEVIRIWDAGTLRQEFVLRGHTGPIQCMAFAPDSLQLISGGQDQVVRLWDLKHPGRDAQPFVQSSPSQVSSVCFSADGKRALSGHFNGTVHWWDLKAGQEVGAVSAGSKPVLSVAFTGDGKRAFAVAETKEFALIDLVAASPIKKFKTEAGTATGVLSLSAEGDRLVVAVDNTVVVWNPKTGERTRSLNGHTAGVSCVALSRDGRRALSGGLDRTIRFWDTESGECLHVFEGHAGPVTGLALSPDGARALSAGEDRVARLWDLEKKTPFHPPEGHTYGVQAVAFSPNGRLLASCGGDGRVLIWRLSDRTVRHSIDAETPSIPCVTFSADSHKIFYCAAGRKVPVLDAESGNRVSTLPVPNNYALETMVRLPGTGQLVSCVGLPYAVLWNVENGQTNVSYNQHFKLARCAAVSSDGRLVVTGGDDWNLFLFEAATGKIVGRYAGHTDSIRSVGFTRDGRHIVSVGADKAVWRWEVPPGRGRTKILTIPSQPDAGKSKAPLTATAFAPDGRFLASACTGEGRVVLWDLDRAEKVAEWNVFGKVNQLVFSADGSRFAAAQDNGAVSIYPVPVPLR